jgi:hypothetical protein
VAIKTHLKQPDEPLKEGQNYFSLCGDVVPQAAFVFMWDEIAMGAMGGLDMSLRLCRRCREMELTKRYIYGIRAAGEQVEA